MKKFSTYLLLILALLTAGCSNYDDTKVVNRIDELEERLQSLEELCKQANTNMVSLQALIVAVQRNDTITGITAITKDGEVVGYTITFAKGGPITIYNSDAATSGQVPQIGVKEDADGNFYWTLGGEWMLDAEGNKIAVEEKEAAPRFKVEEGYWYVSYDNGASWEQLGPATDGSTGSSESIFADVDTSQDGFIIFTLLDGSKISVPTSQDHSYIDFLDNTAELLCIMNWDTNGDDKLSYEEAAAVESIGNVFEQTNIISFNEFKYFTSVKKLEEKAFDNCKQLRKITLPESLEEIGTFALCQLHNLKEITIPASVTTIAERAMAGNPILEKIVVAEGNTVYDSRGNCNALIHTETNRLLAGCCNTVIPDGIQTIGQHAFLYTKIENVIIPDSVTSIEWQAFCECDNMKTMSIGKNVTTWGNQVFYKATGDFTINSNIPDCNNQYASPFYTCHMSSLTFGPDVTSIGANPFTWCDRLAKVYIPANVRSLGHNLFSNGRTFDELEVHCAEIGKGAFTGDTALKLILGDEVRIIGESAFSSGGAESVVWGSGIESIGKSAFSNSDINEAILSNVTNIGEYAFKSCGLLKSVTLSDKLESIPEEAFYKCTQLSEISFPASLKTIASRALAQTAIVSAILPEGLTEIGSYTFEACSAIQTLEIPSTVETIGNRAFYGCSGVVDIKCPLPSKEYLFDNASFTKVTLSGKIEKLPPYIFSSCASLEEVVLPEDLSSIEECAFWKCTALKSINLPSSLTSIEASAFSACKSLERVVIPEGITELSDDVFRECSNLSEIVLPKSLLSIQDWALAYCESLTELVIPENVNLIKWYAFGGSGIKTIFCRPAVPPTVEQGYLALDDVVIYVPTESLYAYQTSSSWKRHAESISAYDFSE